MLGKGADCEEGVCIKRHNAVVFSAFGQDATKSAKQDPPDDYVPRFEIPVGLSFVNVHPNLAPIVAGYTANQNNFRYFVGINFTLGGAPPIPPTASCSVSPSEVFIGDPVSASISAQNFNPKHFGHTRAIIQHLIDLK
jgi:hypothetical protein